MMHPPRRRQEHRSESRRWLVVACLLVLALAARPLHTHELRAVSTTTQISGDSLSPFCFDCTFGPDQAIFHSPAAIAVPVPAVAAETPLTTTALTPAAPDTASRAPPAA